MKISASLLTLSALFATVSAKINLAAPINPVSGGQYTVTWSHEAADPSEFILMLQLASDSWATGQFWEFTQTQNDKLDVTFLNTYPYVILPGENHIYRLTARNQSNVDMVYSRSPDFHFLSPQAAPPSSSASSTTSVTTFSSTSSSKSTTSTTVTNAQGTTTSSSSTVTSTNSSATQTLTTTTSSTGTSATAPATTSNAGSSGSQSGSGNSGATSLSASGKALLLGVGAILIFTA